MVCGCITNSLTVDDKEEMDLADDERRNVLKRIFEHLKPNDLNGVIRKHPKQADLWD